MKFAEELESDELVTVMNEIMAKPQWERSRDFKALLHGFGEYLKRLSDAIKEDDDEALEKLANAVKDEDPNAGKGDETPQSEARGPDDPPEDEKIVGVPVVYGEHDPDVNVGTEITIDGVEDVLTEGEVIDAEVTEDGGTEPKKPNEEDEE